MPPTLITPTPAVHASFLAAMEEFRAEGRRHVHDDSALGAGTADSATRWHDPAVFERYVA